MGSNMKGIIGMVAGYAALIGIMYRANKILKERSSERSDEEKMLFLKRDQLQKETEAIKWKEKETMLKRLEQYPGYKEAKDRIFELQKIAAESKSLNIKHDDLNFGISSGNKNMIKESIYHEESKIREIKSIIKKSIEAARSIEEKEIFQNYEDVLNEVSEVLKRERVGLWKEVFFGWRR